MLLFLDSIAYGSSQIGAKYSSVVSDQVTWSVDTGGPNSRRCVRRVSTSNNAFPGYLVVTPLWTQSGVWTPTTGFVFGFRFKILDLARLGTPPGVDYGLFTVRGPLVSGAGETMYRLVLATDGSLSWQHRFNTTTYTTDITTASVVANDTWVYLEVELVISASVGTATVSANGTQIGSFSGDNFPTLATAGTFIGTWSSLRHLALHSAPTPFLDVRMLDLYLFDRAGSRNNAKIGPHEVNRLVPTGAGASTGWTPSAGANWAAVDEVPPDDDTTYVSASTAGTRDAYVFESVPAGVDPPGVTVSLYAKKTGAGSAALKPSILGQDGPNAIGLVQDTYRYLSQPYDTNPADSQPFESADLTTPQAGVVKTL